MRLATGSRTWGACLGGWAVPVSEGGRFRFMFEGRIESLVVGMAYEGMLLDSPPKAMPRGGGGGSLHPSARCVAWRSDGSFVCEGAEVCGDDESMCIEGDWIGLVVSPQSIDG